MELAGKLKYLYGSESWRVLCNLHALSVCAQVPAPPPKASETPEPTVHKTTTSGKISLGLLALTSSSATLSTMSSRRGTRWRQFSRMPPRSSVTPQTNLCYSSRNVATGIMVCRSAIFGPPPKCSTTSATRQQSKPRPVFDTLLTKPCSSFFSLVLFSPATFL